jgi:aerobic-type carbon monoxide dehydrogenase small subunit (CoxS/CutS family)
MDFQARMSGAVFVSDRCYCNLCTPGMILWGRALLIRSPNPTDEEVREAISGNECRCAGYIKIVEAIKAAAMMEPERRNTR